METYTTTRQNCLVECLEISISKNSLETHGHNLLWTLAVYTLDNQPLKSPVEKGDILRYRIMVYDWKKTVKRLLDENKIPYSFSQVFILDTIHRQPKKKIHYDDKDAEILFGSNYDATPDAKIIEEAIRKSLPRH
ncbi:MAG: hypothetical protein ABIR06_05065 [Cyclobacteriaceae bacterium]